METYITVAVILAIVGLAAWYVIRAKRKGKKCIGCPESCRTSSEGGCSGCAYATLCTSQKEKEEE